MDGLRIFLKKLLRNQNVTYIFVTDLLHVNNKIPNAMRRDVFQAIADPTRREIIHLLADKPMNLNAVAGKFDISRPAISKHIKLLAECGPIEVKQQGRERYCKARPERLNEVSKWVEQYRRFWENRLDAMEEYLDQLQTKK